jgi:hypothetical protein
VPEEDSPDDWLRAVEQELDDALANAPVEFAALLQALSSVDPLVVVGALRRRAEHGSASAAVLLAAAFADRGEGPISPRPIAHPLEYDWRFTAETATELVARLGRTTGAGQTIGYLGAPAAFALAAQELPGRQHVLLDRSARWPAPPSGRARIISVDLLRDPLPALELDAAVLDPPWYPEYHDAFLWTAASLLRTRGVALASFPPLTMRPGVAAEREEIIGNAVRAGLLVEHHEPLVLRYETPPFERAAFAAAGVRAVPDDWRRGDMLTLRKTDDRAAKRPAPSSREPEWTFVEIDGIPLAMRELDAASETITSPLIEPAVPGVVLPTVSRRDSARADAVLWSSRNRIYKSNAPTALRALVRSLASGGDAVGAAERALERPLTTAEEENVVAAANELRKLIQTEREEHGLG